MTARWSTPGGFTVEDMDLELVPRPKRHYDAAGGDGPYLLVRYPGGTTAGFVTGRRAGRSNTDVWADVAEFVDLRDLARTDSLALAA